jgi:hypothetical protein
VWLSSFIDFFDHILRHYILQHERKEIMQLLLLLLVVVLLSRPNYTSSQLVAKHSSSSASIMSEPPRRARHSRERDFHNNILTPDQIRREFTKRPCCKKNCMEVVFNMPTDPRIQPCNFSPSNDCACLAPVIICLPVGSPLLPSSSSVEIFAELVDAIRAPTLDWRKNDKEWTDFLITKFEDKKIKSASREGSVDWIYDILHPKKGLTTVCRGAFLAMFGVDLQKTLYIQTCVKEKVAGLVSQRGTFVEPSRASSAKEIFGRFGLDYDKYLNGIKSWCDFSMVGDTAVSLVATAWLLDYIDLDGDEQVKHSIIYPTLLPMESSRSGGGPTVSCWIFWQLLCNCSGSSVTINTSCCPIRHLSPL